MTGKATQGYGHAHDVFVSRKPTGDSLVVGGSAEDGKPFVRVVTSGAARVLWFNLTRHLYPEHACEVTAMVPTAPLRSPDRPAITAYVNVDVGSDGNFLLSGWGGRDEWALSMSEIEARRLWHSLDVLLHPVGW